MSQGGEACVFGSRHTQIARLVSAARDGPLAREAPGVREGRRALADQDRMGVFRVGAREPGAPKGADHTCASRAVGNGDFQLGRSRSEACAFVGPAVGALIPFDPPMFSAGSRLRTYICHSCHLLLTRPCHLAPRYNPNRERWNFVGTFLQSPTFPAANNDVRRKKKRREVFNEGMLFVLLLNFLTVVEFFGSLVVVITLEVFVFVPWRNINAP